MNWTEGWQAGLILGAGITFMAEAACRAILFKLRHRKHPHCAECDGCLDDDGRAWAAIEKLRVCQSCGDTIPQSCVRVGSPHVLSVSEGLKRAP